MTILELYNPLFGLETIQNEDLYYLLTWPSVSYVAEDAEGRIVGYILGKMYVPRSKLTFLLIFEPFSCHFNTISLLMSSYIQLTYTHTHTLSLPSTISHQFL
jgi:hypothetical protein